MTTASMGAVPREGADVAPGALLALYAATAGPHPLEGTSGADTFDDSRATI